MASSGDLFNLTGTWQGVYSYARGHKTVPFNATLTETGPRFDGTTEEVGIAGDAIGITLTASLSGTRTGRSLTMVKIYHGQFAYYDSVRYEGDLNEDGTEVHGIWRIPGDWSGTFLMIRAQAVARSVIRETAEKL